MRFARSYPNPARARRAFTLVEILVVMATMVILVGSVIMANLFGLSMAARQQIWLSASGDAAMSIGLLMEDIRSASTLEVGGYTNGTFTVVSSTNQQSGNAIWIFSTTNSTPWSIYYYDTTSNNLVRTNYYGPGLGGDVKLVSANPITNDITHPIFTEVDYTGTAYPNLNAISVMPPSVQVYMSFTKLQNPDVTIESGSVVDLYQIISIVTPRVHQ